MTRSTFRVLLVWALCLCGSGFALAAPVAYVHELTGKLQLQYGTRAPQQLNVGSTLEPGAILITGAGSNAVVKFEDGQIVALQPDTRFAVRGYEFVKTNVAKSNSALELLAGGLRFVTGIIGTTNRSAFNLIAGTATIGIRGTDGTLLIDRATGAVSAATNSGALAITTPLGTSNIPAGNFVTAPRNLPPPPAAPAAQAPPALAREIAQARAVTMPANTAISVPASARAAAAQAQATAAERAVQAATTDTARQAAERAAAQARAAAAAAAQAAAQATEQVTQSAVRAGAVLPAPPAAPLPSAPAAPGATPRPGAAAPSPAAPAALATTTAEPSTASTATQPSAATAAEPTSVSAMTDALPATAAGQPATTPEQQPVTQPLAQPLMQPVTQAPTVTATPTATGSGAGGGGTASLR